MCDKPYTQAEADAIFRLTGERVKSGLVCKPAPASLISHHRTDAHRKRPEGHRPNAVRSGGGEEALMHHAHPRTNSMVAAMAAAIAAPVVPEPIGTSAWYQPPTRVVVKKAAATASVTLTPNELIMKRMSKNARNRVTIANNTLRELGEPELDLQNDLGLNPNLTTQISKSTLNTAIATSTTLSPAQRDVVVAVSDYASKATNFDNMDANKMQNAAQSLAMDYSAKQKAAATAAAAAAAASSANLAQRQQMALKLQADAAAALATATQQQADAYTAYNLAVAAQSAATNKKERTAAAKAVASAQANLAKADNALNDADMELKKADADVATLGAVAPPAAGGGGPVPPAGGGPVPPAGGTSNIPALDPKRGDTVLHNAGGVIMRGDANQYIALYNEALNESGVNGVSLADIYGPAGLPADITLDSMRASLGQMQLSTPQQGVLNVLDSHIDHSQLGTYDPQTISMTALSVSNFYTSAPAAT